MESTTAIVGGAAARSARASFTFGDELHEHSNRPPDSALVSCRRRMFRPARRKLAKNEMRRKISQLREQLSDTLHAQFEREIQRSLQNIHTAIAPYTRFVRAEQGNLLEVQKSLENSRLELTRIRETIENQ